MAVNLLARIMDEPPAHPIRLEVGTRLLVRDTTGPRLHAEQTPTAGAGRSSRAARRPRAARGRRRSPSGGTSGRRARAPARPDEVVGAEEVLAFPIVEPRTSSCFHQNRWSCAGGLGPDVAPHTTTRPAGRTDASDRAHVASPTVSTTTSTPLPVASLTAAATSPSLWFTVTIRAPIARGPELRVAAGGDDRSHAERSADLECGGRDAPADAPDEDAHSPSRTAARVTSIRYAVSYTSGKAAPTSNDSASSRGNTCSASIAMSSACVPSKCSPTTVIRSPWSRPGLMTTRDPIGGPDAPSPSASTTPAPSAPRMRGFGTEEAFRTQTSRWLSDAARMRTSTWPGPATGSGPPRRGGDASPPSSWMRAASAGTILS